MTGLFLCENWGSTIHPENKGVRRKLLEFLNNNKTNIEYNSEKDYICTRVGTVGNTAITYKKLKEVIGQSGKLYFAALISENPEQWEIFLLDKCKVKKQFETRFKENDDDRLNIGHSQMEELGGEEKYPNVSK